MVFSLNFFFAKYWKIYAYSNYYKLYSGGFKNYKYLTDIRSNHMSAVEACIYTIDTWSREDMTFFLPEKILKGHSTIESSHI